MITYFENGFSLLSSHKTTYMWTQQEYITGPFWWIVICSIFALSVEPRLFSNLNSLCFRAYIHISAYISYSDFLMYLIPWINASFQDFAMLFFYHLWLTSAWQIVGREHSIECLLNERMNTVSLYFLMFFNDIQMQYTVKHTYTQGKQKFYKIFLIVVSWYYFFPFSFFLIH